MNTSEGLNLQRLLGRREATALIKSIEASVSQIALALVRNDGTVFVSTSSWTQCNADASSVIQHLNAEQIITVDDYRLYPLKAGEHLVGAMTVFDQTPPRGRSLERGLHHSLNVMLTDALAKRDVASDALDRYREINLMYRVSETIGAFLQVDQIATLVLEESKRVIRSDAGTVFLSSSDGHAWQVQALFGTESHPGSIDQIAHEALGPAWQSDRPAIVTDFASVFDYDALLWAPLKTRDRVLGGIVLGRLPGQPIFTASDEKLLMALARQAAVAVDNARLHQAVLDKERLEHELQLARDLQGSLISRHAPIIPGWEFAAFWNPARQVGGDFFDFIPGVGASPPPAQNWGVVIADVSDKGMHAALFMALTRSILRATTTAGQHPATSVAQSNRLLCNDSVDGMFVTLFYAQLDPLKHEMTYVNAGHNPPLLYRADSQKLVELERTGIMLGFDDTATFEQQTVAFQPGDLIVLYTDGVTEALDVANEQFGEERLYQCILTHHENSPTEMLQALRGVIAQFVGDFAQSDDITIVIGKRLAEPGMIKTIAIPQAHLADLEKLHALIDAFAAQTPLDDSVVFALRLAIEEVFVNLVQHGYRADVPGPVNVTLESHRQYVLVKIQDHAKPFPPDQAPKPNLALSLADRPIGGLGWYFVREMMDEIHYTSDPNTGNVLTLIKRLDSK